MKSRDKYRKEAKENTACNGEPNLLGWRAKLLTSVLVLGAAAILGLAASVSLGSTSVPIITTFKILTREVLGLLGLSLPVDWTESSRAIVWDVRLPRSILAFLVGSCLGVAGTTFQGLLRNPLGDPYTLGVSSGATVGAAMVMVFGWQLRSGGILLLPMVAMIGGLGTLLLVYKLAEIGGRVQNETLILAGVVMSAFMSAIFSFLVAIAGSRLHQVVSWVMGSLALTSWMHVWLILPYFVVGSLIVLSRAMELNVLALGEESAAHVGVDVERSKKILIFAATLLTGAAVSVSGTVGFVGLIVPHVVRLLIGPDHRLLVPVGALTGGIFLLGADTLARLILAPVELPVGVITAAAGGPFFAYVLRNRRKNMYLS